jgi:hypothetical protein
MNDAKLGQIVPREYGIVSIVVARRRSDEAIHARANRDMDCFAEPVTGARARDPLARNDGEMLFDS